MRHGLLELGNLIGTGIRGRRGGWKHKGKGGEESDCNRIGHQVILLNFHQPSIVYPPIAVSSRCREYICFIATAGNLYFDRYATAKRVVAHARNNCCRFHSAWRVEKSLGQFGTPALGGIWIMGFAGTGASMDGCGILVRTPKQPLQIWATGIKKIAKASKWQITNSKSDNLSSLPLASQSQRAARHTKSSAFFPARGKSLVIVSGAPALQSGWLSSHNWYL
jgi:hypothetical protein